MLKLIARTGKIVLGSKRTLKLLKLGKIKYIIMASNAPSDIAQEIEYYSKLSEVKVIRFPGTNSELGSVLGKPFKVAVMGIEETGQVPSEVLDRYSS